MSYETERREIQNQLESVSGIGKVFDHKRYQQDWKTFFSKYVTNLKKVNVTWFTQVQANEDATTEIGDTEEDDTIQHTQRDVRWTIEFFYALHDDDYEPSEFEFLGLCERIEDKFRYLQNLNGVVYKSFPLRRLSSGFWQFGLGEVLCHRAEWVLDLRIRTENTGVG